MKKIGIIIPEGRIFFNSVTGAYYLLQEAANPILGGAEEGVDFDVQIISGSGGSVPPNEQFAIHPDADLSVCKRLDLLIIPGIRGPFEQQIVANESLLALLRECYLQHGVELASMCTGAFLLAATGLLDGKVCATHWALANEFRQCYPKVRLRPEEVITDTDGLYTSGGAYTSLNLMLYLIEKFADRKLALKVARFFNIHIDQRSQMPFAIFQTQKNHGDAAIAEVQQYIESHFSEPITVKGLAVRFAFSSRSFIRRFKAATGNSPIEYIQRVRIEAAKRLLENSHLHISELVYQTGYNDLKSFRDVFRKLTGLSPKAYRDKYTSRN